MKPKHYFATDGNYGEATGMVVVDTSKWCEADWENIENSYDTDRPIKAQEIANQYASPKKKKMTPKKNQLKEFICTGEIITHLKQVDRLCNRNSMVKARKVLINLLKHDMTDYNRKKIYRIMAELMAKNKWQVSMFIALFEN